MIPDTEMTNPVPASAHTGQPRLSLAEQPKGEEGDGAASRSVLGCGQFKKENPFCLASAFLKKLFLGCDSSLVWHLLPLSTSNRKC